MLPPIADIQGQQMSSPPAIPGPSSVNANNLPASPRQSESSGPLSLSLPPLGFEVNTGPRSPEDRRPLSPITERSTPMEARSLSAEKSLSGGRAHPGSRQQAIPEETSVSILSEPLVTSPTATSPPPDQNVIMGRPSVDSYRQSPGSRPDSKLGHQPGQIVNVPSRSSTSQSGSPQMPSQTYRQMSPEPRPITPSTPPRFAAAAAAASRGTISPPTTPSALRAASPPSSIPIPASQAQPPVVPSQPPQYSRMVPNRSTSQASIPTSMYTIPPSQPSYAAAPSSNTPLYSPTSPKLQQKEPAHQKRPSLPDDDILGDAGAALFYMQHMQQQQDSTAPIGRRQGPPPPPKSPRGEEDDTSDSESEPYTPPPRAVPSPLRVKQASSPSSGTSSMHPPVVPTKSPTPSANQGPSGVETPAAAPRPGSGLRKPSGARAAPATRMSALIQNSIASDNPPTDSATATTTATPTTDNDTDRDRDSHLSDMAAAAHELAAGYDDNADALAALSFLEQDSRPAPPPVPQSPPARSARSPTMSPPPPPEVIETPASPSRRQARAAEQPRSSFAPTKLAAQRKAKSQAQQAAQQAAAQRPGKANGKGRMRTQDAGAWGESSEEEEEEEEEDDEDVDSDAEPPRMPASVSDHRSQSPAQRSLYGAGTNSPARSATDVNSGALPPPRRPRDLPQLPGGQRAYPLHNRAIWPTRGRGPG